MDTAWKFDRLEEDQDTTPRPWQGTHARPRATLRLTFADGTWEGLSYSDYKGYRLRDNVLKIYFTTATVVCVGRALQALAALLEDEAAREIRERHTSPFEVARQEGFIERIELQPPQPEELCQKA